MNIKSVLSPNQIQSVKTVDRVERAIQSDNTHDRDPNNQSGYQSQNQNNQPLTEDEIKYYLEHLKNLPFVKEHNWIIEFIEVSKSSRYVVVKDQDGNQIRRFSEFDLRTLPSDIQDTKGQLLKKTA